MKEKDKDIIKYLIAIILGMVWGIFIYFYFLYSYNLISPFFEKVRIGDLIGSMEVVLDHFKVQLPYILLYFVLIILYIIIIFKK